MTFRWNLDSWREEGGPLSRDKGTALAVTHMGKGSAAQGRGHCTPEVMSELTNLTGKEGSASVRSTEGGSGSYMLKR